MVFASRQRVSSSLRSPILVQQRIDLIAPIFGAEQLGPTHLARDDLVPLWIVEIFLQQLHVFLGLLVLLLKETLPVVFVPKPVPVSRSKFGHEMTKGQLGTRAKDFPRLSEDYVGLQFPFGLQAQLSAGRVDVVTFFAAKCRGHFGLAQDRQKFFLLFCERVATMAVLGRCCRESDLLLLEAGARIRPDRRA